MKINWILIAFLVFGSWVLKAQVADSSAMKKVDSLITLSWNYRDEGMHDESISTGIMAKNLALEKFGKKSDFYIRATNNLGRSQQEISNFKEAENLYIEALNLLPENKDQKDSLFYASILSNLGNLFRETGRYDDAEKFLLESTEISKKITGGNNLDYVRKLIRLANFYDAIGRSEKTEVMLLIAKSIIEKEMGTDNAWYAVLSINLSNAYNSLGRKKEAEKYLLIAKKIYGNSPGKNRKEYATVLGSLASLYDDFGEYDKAVQLYLECLSMRDSLFGKEHPGYAHILYGLGITYHNMKRYPEAERCYKEASQIFEAVFGKDNYDYILCEHELGVLAHDLGNKTEAESKYLEVKSLLEKSFGKENQPYVTNIQWLAGLYRETNRWEKVGQLVREAGQIQRRILLRSFSYFSESELASYLPLFSTYKDTRLDITWLNPLPELSEASFDDILFYKGFLLECATQMRRIASQADDSTQTLFKTWLACNRRLSSGEVFSDSEKQLVEEANSIERALTHHSAILGNNIRQVEWKEIRDKLQLSDAIVEFVHFEFNPIGDPSDSVLYAALVIRKNDPHPVFIRLFEEKQLDTLLLHKTTDSEQYVGLVYRNPKLYKLIWEPFDSLLDGVTRIYYSPSGLLHRVSLPAIAERADGPLLADRYSLQYVSSTRELVVGKEKLYGKDIQTGLVYGGIRYETDSIKMAGSLSKLDADFKKWSPDTVALPKMSTAHTDTLLQSWASILHRGSDERADPRYLPGSLREMEKTGRLFKSKSIRTMTLSEYEASEESFKRLGEDFPSPDVIHVSTHGFFFPDPVRRKEDADKPILFAGNPLFRSGLHFAGSIQAWRKNAPLKGFDDGILYAYEVSHLNLSNTKLVVLSACETGLGDIRGSEGVYGLQRAFRLAGAQHILMSLWKISDDATVDFMETFYLNWLSGKETDIREAFARTQKEMRKKYKDPYYWAAFVLI